MEPENEAAMSIFKAKQECRRRMKEILSKVAADDILQQSQSSTAAQVVKSLILGSKPVPRHPVQLARVSKGTLLERIPLNAKRGNRHRGCGTACVSRLEACVHAAYV
jgi:hypothetical protein